MNMSHLKSRDLIIQIDDEVAGLIGEINAGPRGRYRLILPKT